MDSGDSEALVNLGVIYYRGYPGVERNTKKAMKYFNEAAELGRVGAMYNLASLYFNNNKKMNITCE